MISSQGCQNRFAQNFVVSGKKNIITLASFPICSILIQSYILRILLQDRARFFSSRNLPPCQVRKSRETATTSNSLFRRWPRWVLYSRDNFIISEHQRVFVCESNMPGSRSIHSCKFCHLYRSDHLLRFNLAKNYRQIVLINEWKRNYRIKRKMPIEYCNLFVKCTKSECVSIGTINSPLWKRVQSSLILP